MTIYCTPYAPLKHGANMLSLVSPARRERHLHTNPVQGVIFAHALLAYALEQEGFPACAQALHYSPEGRPYLPGTPLHLSISHSKTYALCVLAPQPVGCDIETHRPVSERTCRRVLGPDEAPEDFFAHWTLKESYLKLTGDLKRPFATVQFALQADNTAKAPDAYGHLYRDIPACTAAVVAAAPFPRPPLQILPAETLFDYAAEKWG